MSKYNKYKEFYNRNSHRFDKKDKEEFREMTHYYMYGISTGMVAGVVCQIVLRRLFMNSGETMQRISRIGGLLLPIVYAHKLLMDKMMYPYFEKLEAKYVKNNDYVFTPYVVDENK